MSKRVVVTIDNYYQGKSSQPDFRRFAGQLEDDSNIDYDASVGARKRVATDLVTDLSLSTSNDYKVFTLDDRRIFVGDGEIKAFKNDGTGVEVDDLTGTGFAYLSGVTPSAIDGSAALDTLVILNRTKEVETEEQAEYTIKETVSNFDDLLGLSYTPALEDVFKVRCSRNNDPSGYYQYQGGGVEDPEAWLRVTAPGSDSKYKASTMPHRLVYLKDAGELQYSTIPWGERQSGSSNSNPVQPWVGETIRSVCWHKGRLFFIGRDVISATRGGQEDKFSLFVKDAGHPVATDPISIDNLYQQLGTPLRALPLKEDLLVICSRGAFAFTSGTETLTASNGAIVPVSDFNHQDVAPASDGSIAVAVDEGNLTRVYTWDGRVYGVVYGGSFNEHQQDILNGITIRDMAWHNGRLFVIPEGDDLRVYKHRSDSAGFVQMAWSTWTRQPDGEYAYFIDSYQDKIRYVVKGETYSLLEQHDGQPVAPDGHDIDPRMDRRQLKSYLSYDPQHDRTTFATTGRDATTDVWLQGPSGLRQKAISASARQAVFQGDYRDQEYYIGFGYDAIIELSHLWARSFQVRPMVQKMTFAVEDTTSFSVQRRLKSTSSWKTVGTFSYATLGATHLGEEAQSYTGIWRRMVLGDARSMNLRLVCPGAQTATGSIIEYVVKEMQT